MTGGELVRRTRRLPAWEIAWSDPERPAVSREAQPEREGALLLANASVCLLAAAEGHHKTDSNAIKMYLAPIMNVLTR